MAKDDAEYYRSFVAIMDSLIRDFDSNDGRNQKQLIDKLIELENKFKKLLLTTDSGKAMYKEFMNFILKENNCSNENFCGDDVDDSNKEENGNILRARVFFRERQNVFKSKIARAFYLRRPTMLHKLNINYEFIKWVMDRYNGPKKQQLNNIYSEIKELRQKICELNLPLAINRAKIFWSKISETKLEYMDLIQCCAEGLMAAIDKFVPKDGVFAGVAIGRMTLNMLTDHNDTLLKIPPKEKRILYRAKNAQHKENIHEIKDIQKYVNKSFKKTSLDTILMVQQAVTNIIDINSTTQEGVPHSDLISDNRISIEDNVIDKDLKMKMLKCVNKMLSNLERKVILLKNGIL